MIAYSLLNPVSMMSSRVTSEVLLIYKNSKPVEFPSNTTTPSEVMVNFLPETVKFRLSVPV